MPFVVVAGHRLEYEWHGPPPESARTLVFLHEGLGSVSLWRDFPRRVADATGYGALVYSRWGYGQSDPVTLPRPVRYMHDEALTALPQVLTSLNVQEAVLVGHSDGASIAIIHAGSQPAGNIRGLVLEAPHVFAEELSLKSIAEAAAGPTPTEPCARGWRAITRTPTVRSGDGIAPGWTRSSSTGTSRSTCRPSASPSSSFKAKRTRTGRCDRSRPFGGAARDR